MNNIRFLRAVLWPSLRPYFSSPSRLVRLPVRAVRLLRMYGLRGLRDVLVQRVGMNGTSSVLATMSLAVGGHYEDMGNIEADLLHEWGLKDGHFVIDIGCGSGRLASAMQKRSTEIQYLGTDVVPELLEYAKTKAPPHYRFQLSTEFSIPASDASADFVTFFSVFTHLYHEESFAYLKDALRVLRKGGAVIFSFLETGQHWSLFTEMMQQRLELSTIELTMFIERPMIDVWASELGFHIEQYKVGAPLGQSVVLLRKP